MMPDTQSNRTTHIRSIVPGDRSRIQEIVIAAGNFSEQEIATAMELVDEALRKGEESGYIIMVAETPERAGEIDGYACYGPTPLTEGVFDLYWIAVDPKDPGTRNRPPSGRICGKGYPFPRRANAPDRDFLPRRIRNPRLRFISARITNWQPASRTSTISGTTS